jgi:hypothetical protein
VLSSLVPSPGPATKLQWVSPLAENLYREYQDAEFLQRLGLSNLAPALREFWPEGGPCWDALARVTGCSAEGVVLVEAKSHASGVQSSCRAENPVSRARIQASLACAKRRLGVSADVDWMEAYYQAANRYAHLIFLRDIGVQAWLVEVYFLNDKHFVGAPATEEEWQAVLKNVSTQMGLTGKSVPFVSKLFVPAPNI